MDPKEMIKRTEDDFKNFNAFVGRLRECKVVLNCYTGQEDRFSEEVRELNLLIHDYEYKLKIMKISLDVLSEEDQLILTDYYFTNMLIDDIAIKLNVSSNTISKHKKKSIEELSKIMYGHFDDIDYIFFTRIEKDKKRKENPIYQYDSKGKFINRWHSVKKCEENGFKKGDIYKCCSGKLNLYKGYKWSYIPLFIQSC